MKLIILLIAALAVGAAHAHDNDPSQPLAAAEAHFLDFLDADSAVGLIDSGFTAEFEGRDRAAWETARKAQYDHLTAALAQIDEAALTKEDAAALAAMRVTLADHADPSAATAHDPAAPRCADAHRTDLDYAGLRAALVSCFRELGNHMYFEGRVIDRGTALQLLHDIEEPERRMLLFDAFQPLWDALNGGNRPDSPWRRMIRMAAEEAAQHGSQIDAAAKAIGVTTPQVEQWLVRILEAWRDANPQRMVEPWDYRYQIGKANRALAKSLTSERLLPLNKRFFADLGADLGQLDVLFDLAERPDKSPLAYSDFLRRGRATDAGWQRPRARIVGRYPLGGLFSINELVHENGHAVHVSAIRTRPAHMDWPDTIFTEAFADVPAWSVYERAWQRKYLGRAVSQKDSLRALHGLTTLDVAWSLFEIRMLRDPAADPNRVWSAITGEYLRILPHPQVPWWAMRVQLASQPGYMVNYGLGAVLAAEMRARTREQIGPFDAGNPAWYGWLSERLLRHGSGRDTQRLMQDFLGRPPSPDAVLSEIRRIR
ncbi:MAG: hypothetical protein KF822_01050 [Steroidobacteraceae bacterium]|nr:hypothetical protein [Steroidobacteraceae bacterium]